MQTTIQSQSIRSKTDAATKSNLNSLWARAESYRYGIMTYLILVIGVAGGIAIAFGAGSHPVEMAAVVFPTILSLAFMLAVTPMRLIFSVSLLALVLDILVLIF